MSNIKKSQKQQQKVDANHLIDLLFKTQYMDKKSFYLQSFFRGIVTGAGTVLGATLLIAILIWFLALFDTVPLIGPFIDNARQTIEQKN